MFTPRRNRKRAAIVAQLTTANESSGSELTLANDRNRKPETGRILPV
jgi:hypothetical protein